MCIYIYIDNSTRKIHINSNFILSISLLIKFKRRSSRFPHRQCRVCVCVCVCVCVRARAMYLFMNE